MKSRTTLEVYQDPYNGVWVARAVEIPGTVATGHSEEQALENIKIVIGRVLPYHLKSLPATA